MEPPKKAAQEKYSSHVVFLVVNIVDSFFDWMNAWTIIADISCMYYVYIRFQPYLSGG